MSLTTDRLSETFAALGDPTRLAIVARLAEGDATVKELAEPFPVSLPAISRHLKVLEHAGLITRGRSAQSRPSRLRVEALSEATAWIDARRELWEGRMDRLDRHLKTIQEADRP
jgi:DNA-binding transcriptional ArsR family regulator